MDLVVAVDARGFDEGVGADEAGGEVEEAVEEVDEGVDGGYGEAEGGEKGGAVDVDGEGEGEGEDVTYDRDGAGGSVVDFGGVGVGKVVAVEFEESDGEFEEIETDVEDGEAEDGARGTEGGDGLVGVGESVGEGEYREGDDVDKLDDEVCEAEFLEFRHGNTSF